MIGSKTRKVLRALHRDFGFACVTLSIIYAISGIAVNHTKQWNPNYRIEKVRLAIPDRQITRGAVWEQLEQMLRLRGITGEIKNRFNSAPGVYQFFLKGRTITINTLEHYLEDERIKARPILRPMNFLHLNQGKGLWTWVADLYAFLLLFLAVSGALIVKGKKGIWGRGGIYILIGTIIPLLFLLIQYYLPGR